MYFFYEEHVYLHSGDLCSFMKGEHVSNDFLEHFGGQIYNVRYYLHPKKKVILVWSKVKPS
jgi:hypothetical protein